MAVMLKDRGGVDWVINNDADEFWMTNDLSSLPDALSKSLGQRSIPTDEVGVVTCRRNNYVPSREIVTKDAYTFRDNIFKVRTDWKDVSKALNLNPDENTALLSNNRHDVVK